jgi:hypothetical protein
MSLRIIAVIFFFSSLLIFSGCRQNVFQSPTVAPTTLRDVPALRLNFRYEADVPAPPEAIKAAPVEERNPAVQADFDQNRAQELLDKTIVSPDKNRILAVFHRPGDVQAEFRLDMYAADGRFLRRVTPETMAVHFPDTIVWSPDSTTVAFVAMTRAGAPGSAAPPVQPDANTNTQANSSTNSSADTAANANSSANAETADANVNAAPPPATTPTPVEPTGVLTFRTEQIYTCGSDGDGIKPVTQNEGLIYFYYVWSPDSSMLASLAATYREWQFLQLQADQKGEQFAPLGRPRLVEKNGRERRLDDALTLVQPVWSPDSAKVAVAFDRQIRIYDAIGNNTTQAAVPLRNQLLLSSQAYDQELQRKAAANGESGMPTNANAAPNQPTTLPDEASLVSFNPIIDLEWTTEEMIYFQTGYVKQMKTEADSVRSYLRWHRLVLSPQAVSLGK